MHSSALTRFLRHRMAVLCLGIFILVVLFALLGPFFSPYAPTQKSGGFSAPPDSAHLLGTDKIGRDLLTRLMHGTRISLLVGLSATVISTLIGVVLGLISGYFGGVLDRILMSVTDMVMSFPYILLVLVTAAIFEPGLVTMILILGFVNWPGVTRLVRGNVLSLRETNFICSDITSGMPRRYILFREILPNTLSPVLVYATSVFALSILDEAALSYLGMGVQPPTPSLGNMLSGAESLSILTGKPWMWLPAGLCIILLVVSINFIGDALRDAMDPRNLA